MKKTLYALSVTVLVVSVITFIACNKNAGKVSTPNQTSNNIPPDVTVTASLQGRVLDENGVPVQGAAVTSGTASTTTDINGVFSFTGISMSSRFGFVKVNKTGYFTGSRSIITNPGASNYVSIQLVPRKAAGTFAANTGGAIAVAAGDTAAFTAASVVTASTNAAYTGTVHVYATYLNPTDSTLYKYMPGDLRGIGTDGKETALQSFGMLQVELEGDGGEKLQLASGQKATLTWAIPASLQATAPATIPLWYFNDTTGRWIQQGSATRQGNNYVGQVAHFTYWNCDVAVPTVNYKVRLIDQHGNPIPYTFVEFYTLNWGTRGNYTDSSGVAQGLMPEGQMLVMRVVTECGGLLAGVNVGPALTDQDLGTVTIDMTLVDLVVKGSVIDCSNNPVDSGFVSVALDGLNYAAAVKNGTFILPITRCYNSSATAKLVAGDFKTSQTGAPVSITVNSNTLDVGQLSACGTPYVAYFTFNYNGVTYSFNNPPDYIDFYLYGNVDPAIEANSATGVSRNVRLIFANLGMGPVGILGLTYQSGGTLIRGGNVNCTITEYDNFIVGTLSGNMYDTTSNSSHTLTGSFKVTRTP